MLEKDSTSVLEPYDGMETVEELMKYARFLYASVQEKDRENLQIRKEMPEIKEELKAANRRADEEPAGVSGFLTNLRNLWTVRSQMMTR